MSEHIASSPGGREPRVWTTSQLVIGLALALVTGLIIGYGEKPSSKPGAADALKTSSSPTTTVAVAYLPTVQPGPPTLETTTIVPDTTTTTSTTIAVTTTAPAGPKLSPGTTGILLRDRATGAGRSQAFTVAPGGWKLGWGYDCSRFTSDGTFQVTVLNADGTPGTEAPVHRVAAKATGVEQYTSSGTRLLEVTTSCVWEVKVVGTAA